MSVSTLRRREGDVLTPIVDADGVHLFDEAEMRSVMVTVRARASVAALGTWAGDVAADVFTLLDDGMHPVEIVKQLRLTPDVVVSLHEQWLCMRGGFAVGPDSANRARPHRTWIQAKHCRNGDRAAPATHRDAYTYAPRLCRLSLLPRQDRIDLRGVRRGDTWPAW